MIYLTYIRHQLDCQLVIRVKVVIRAIFVEFTFNIVFTMIRLPKDF